MPHTAVLRRVGGSVMLAIPPALLDVTNLAVGNEVAVTVEAGRLVVEPRLAPHYTLDELLAQCKGGRRRTAEEREWLEGRPVGRESL